MPTKIARPVADNAANSCDVPMSPPGGGANWSVLDEPAPNDDTDYTEAELAENEIGCATVDLDTTFDGTSRDDDHILEARVFWTDTLGGFEAPDLVMNLWQGDPGTGTLIATRIHASITKDAWKTYALKLTESQAAAIADYGDLAVALRFSSSTSTEPGDACIVRATWIEFTTPVTASDAVLQAELDAVRETLPGLEAKVEEQHASHAANPYRGWCWRIYTWNHYRLLPLFEAVEGELEHRLGEAASPPEVPAHLTKLFEKSMKDIENQLLEGRKWANHYGGSPEPTEANLWPGACD